MIEWSYEMITRLIAECAGNPSACPPDCPLVDDDNCEITLLRLALGMLRDQHELLEKLLAPGRAPTLLTRGELLKLPIGAVCWREFRFKEQGKWTYELAPVLRVDLGGPYLADGWGLYADLLLSDKDGSQTRYWSAKPSKAQRRAEPWKD